MLRGDLAGPHSGAILEILDETLEVMWPQVGLMPDRQRAELVHVIRRYCARLMDQGWLELAFKVSLFPAAPCTFVVQPVPVSVPCLS